MSWEIREGDCLEVLRTLDADSVDALVTDPPAGIGFMGRDWDAPERWKYASASFGLEGERLPGQVIGSTRNPVCLACHKHQRGSDSCQCASPAWDIGEHTRKDRAIFVAFLTAVMAECYRVLKPGAHGLVWALPRTSHWTATAVEDAGFEVRDVITHHFGSGFPKSLDVSKAIDKMDAAPVRRDRSLRFTEWMRSTGITARQVNEVTGSNMGGHYLTAAEQPEVATADMFDQLRPLLPPVPEWVEALVRERTVESENFKRRAVVAIGRDHAEGRRTAIWGGQEQGRTVTASATPDAATWQGWGTSLKPASEHWILARKPLAERNVAANVTRYGTGAINVDGCRVEGPARFNGPAGNTGTSPASVAPVNVTGYEGAIAAGRWPANLVLSHADDCGEECAAGCPVSELDRQSGDSMSRVGQPRAGSNGDGWGMTMTGAEYADTGGASRFFYVPKADRAERNRGVAHLEQRPASERHGYEGLPDLRMDHEQARRAARNHHPTVKPVELMQWLCRLITPPGGLVLDPFAGSGSTGIAALREGFRFLGIEREPEYVEIARARIEGDAPLLNINWNEP